MIRPMCQPTRREVALGGVAFAALLAAKPAFGEDGLERFMAFSREVTGQQDLDPDLGAIYLRALEEGTGDKAPLDFEKERKRILRQWYAGVIDGPDGERAVAYEEALMWRALGFEQPIGTCRGPLGYWSKPPAS